MAAPMRFEARKLLKQLLPTEHGSWAFVFEPAVIGWIAFANLPHRLLLMCGIMGFLAHRPAKLGLGDLWKRKRYPRTIPAVIAAGFLCLGILVCFWFAKIAVFSPDAVYLLALVAIGLGFLVLDSKSGPRSLGRELVGASLMLPLLAMALGGYPQVQWGAPLLGYLLLRVCATVLSVRAVFKRTSDWRWCQGGALVCAAALLPVAFLLHRIPGHSPVPNYAPVAVRSLWLVATVSWNREAKWVGVGESLVSVLCVVLWAIQLGV